MAVNITRAINMRRTVNMKWAVNIMRAVNMRRAGINIRSFDMLRWCRRSTGRHSRHFDRLCVTTQLLFWLNSRLAV